MSSPVRQFFSVADTFCNSSVVSTVPFFAHSFNSFNSTLTRSFSQSATQSIDLSSITSFGSKSSSVPSFMSSSSSSPSPSFTATASATAAVSPSVSSALLGEVSSSSSSRPAPSSSFWTDVYWKIRSWWIPSDHSLMEQSEKSILGLVRKSYKQKFVDIGDDLYINTVHFQSPSAPSSSSSAAVLLHGYAGGLGSWARNYDSLSTLFPSLFSIDWLGTGRSARPEWTAKGVEESEAFFVDSLEKWRQANGISSLELVGHSMGGYLASAYTLRYPQHVSRLILLSPVGMPRPDPNLSERWKQLSLTRRMLFGSIQWLFRSGVTPNDMVKFIGPLGPKPVAGYFSKRFQFAQNGAEERPVDRTNSAYVPPYNKEIYSAYHYHNLALERSGDAVLSQVLGTSVIAHQPMVDRLPSVVVEHNIPTHFVYGESDWMDARCGKSMSELIADEQQRRWRADAAGTSFHITEQCGHQLFIENPRGVYEAIKEIVQIPARKV